MSDLPNMTAIMSQDKKKSTCFYPTNNSDDLQNSRLDNLPRAAGLHGKGSYLLYLFAEYICSTHSRDTILLGGSSPWHVKRNEGCICISQFRVN